MENAFIHGNIIDGRLFAEDLLTDVKARVQSLSSAPHLSVILVGHHAPSEVYVQHKVKMCQRMGIHSQVIRLPENISLKDLTDTIHSLNKDPSVHGILLQLPLPSSMEAFPVLESIAPEKDVDGLTSANLGLLFAGRPRFIPCTPLGCLSLLQKLTDLKGKHAVIVGRSLLVGKPLAALLTMHDATVTLAHRYTENLEKLTSLADIVVVAVGKPGLITASHIKPGAVVLDVGITRVKDQLVGDVAFKEVLPLASAITPVPGGIGPLTVAALMMNTLKTAELQRG